MVIDQNRTKAPGRRQLRVAEIVRHSLAGYLQCYPLQKDGKQIETMITVTAVTMSADLKHARVYVRPFVQPSLPDDWLEKLRISGKNLRNQLGRDLNLKYTPNLHFTTDESFTYAEKIEKIIAEEKRNRYTE